MVLPILFWAVVIQCVPAKCDLHHSLQTQQPICQKEKDYEMFCQHRNLSEVPSLQMPGIKKLDLSYNSIRTLTVESLSNLSSLRHLDISFNRVQSIEPGALGKLQQLRVLVLANNQLGEDLSLSGGPFVSLTRLRELDLSANGWDSDTAARQLKRLPSLSRLRLSANGLTRLTPEMFCGMRSLRQVYLERNAVTEISEGTFECLARLTELDLSMNSLVCVSAFRLPELLVLNLSGNALEFFGAGEDLSGYQLQVLDLSRNLLLHFPSALPAFPQLRYLDLSANLMESLSRGPPDYPEGWDTRNVYKEVTELVRQPRPNLSTDFPNLIWLDLSDNVLMDVAPGALDPFNSLRLLNLSRNCFQNFTLEGNRNGPLASLRSLDLSLNGLREIRAEANLSRPLLPSLESLQLQDNEVGQLPPGLFQLLPNVREVNLARNRVRVCGAGHAAAGRASSRASGGNGGNGDGGNNGGGCVSFSGVLSLRSLSLRGNGIKRLPPRAFSRTPLTHLDLSGNRRLSMADLALGGLEDSLRSLSLRWNAMEASDLSLGCLRRLRALDLSHNLLDSLPGTVTAGCSPLEDLDVRMNELRGFPPETLGNVSRTLQTLRLSGNRLDCCSLAWLETLTGSGVDIPDMGEARCLYNGSASARLLGDHREGCLRGEAKKGNPLIVLIIFSLALLLVPVALVALVMRERCALCLCSGREDSESDTVPVNSVSEHPGEGLTLSTIKVEV